MKKEIKTKLAIGAFAAVLGMTSILPSTSYAMRVDSLDATMGQPAKVEKNEKGNEMRYYRIESSFPGLTEFNRLRAYEIQKDGVVIDRGFAKEFPAGGAKKK